MSNLQEFFRQNLKSFRIKHGLTQAELSKRANFDSTYVGKLERGESSPSMRAIAEFGDILGVNPVKLIRPSRAHLDIRDSIGGVDMDHIPYNPLDIQIFDSLPFPMGIVTRESIPVYVNEAFTTSTGISEEEILDNKLWELPCWTFKTTGPEELEETLLNQTEVNGYLQFHITLGSSDGHSANLFLYPTPVDFNPDEKMMWIFDFRPSEPIDLHYPLTITDYRLIPH